MFSCRNITRRREKITLQPQQEIRKTRTFVIECEPGNINSPSKQKPKPKPKPKPIWSKQGWNKSSNRMISVFSSNIFQRFSVCDSQSEYSPQLPGHGGRWFRFWKGIYQAISVSCLGDPPVPIWKLVLTVSFVNLFISSKTAPPSPAQNPSSSAIRRLNIISGCSNLPGEKKTTTSQFFSRRSRRVA